MTEPLEPTWLCPGCEQRVSLFAGGHPLACHEAKRWEAQRQRTQKRAGLLSRLWCRLTGHSWADSILLPKYQPWCRRCGEHEP